MDNNKMVFVFRNKGENSKEIIVKLFSLYVQLRLEEDEKNGL